MNKNCYGDFPYIASVPQTNFMEKYNLGYVEKGYIDTRLIKNKKVLLLIYSLK